MMPKKIDTLADDIYHLLDPSNDVEHDIELLTSYAEQIGSHFASAITRLDKPRELGKLWASDIGKKCVRQLWYSFHKPESGAPLGGHTRFKFLYGNLLEEAVLYLAKEAGHSVTSEQQEIEYQLNSDWTIRGKIDGIVDGNMVDVKSTSSYGYKRYKDGLDKDNDSFGYIEQLGYYWNFYRDDSVRRGKPAFIFIDKQNGHIKTVHIDPPTRSEIVSRADNVTRGVAGTVLPARFYASKPYGKSGNETLDIACSYCAFKKECWKDANGGKGLRTFLYNQGPVDFVEVKKEPRTLEITDHA